MADLENALSGILSDPDAIRKIQELGKSLGLTEENNHTSSQPLSSLSSLFSKSNSQTPDITSKLSTFIPLLSKMDREDETTTLLKALRPFLSESRQKRLDDAGKMLKVMHILPLISSAGLF